MKIENKTMIELAHDEEADNLIKELHEALGVKDWPTIDATKEINKKGFPLLAKLSKLLAKSLMYE